MGYARRGGYESPVRPAAQNGCIDKGLSALPRPLRMLVVNMLTPMSSSVGSTVDRCRNTFVIAKQTCVRDSFALYAACISSDASARHEVSDVTSSRNDRVTLALRSEHARARPRGTHARACSCAWSSFTRSSLRRSTRARHACTARIAGRICAQNANRTLRDSARGADRQSLTVNVDDMERDRPHTSHGHAAAKRGTKIDRGSYAYRERALTRVVEVKRAVAVTSRSPRDGVVVRACGHLLVT